jgi:hypothetical protein
LPSEASIKFGDQGEVIVTGGPPPDAKALQMVKMNPPTNLSFHFSQANRDMKSRSKIL